MFNAIKMELYRMVRMKSFYVMMIVMVAMTLMTTWAMDLQASDYQESAKEAEQSIEMSTQEVEENSESPDDSDGITIGMQASAPEDDYDFSNITVQDMVFSNLQGMIVAFYLAIFAVLFCGADFNSGYIKNFVGQAKSRTGLVLAKAVAMSIYTIVMIVLYLGVQAAANGIFFGYIHLGDAGSLLSYLGVQTVLHIAFVFICMAIVLISRSTVVSMILSICICWNVLSIVYMGIDIIADKLGVEDFSFSTYTVSGKIGMLEETISRQDGMETLAIVAVYIILALVVGSVAFHKKDI